MTDKQIKETQIRLGDKIRSLRKEHNSNYIKFAEEVGLPRESIHRIEKGVGNPTLKTLLILASALDVELSDIFKEVGI